MNNKGLTYRLKSIFIALGAWELFFWIVFFSLFIYLGNKVSEFRFENPEFIWLFLIIPVLVLGYILQLKWKNKAIDALADKSLRKYLMFPVSSMKSFAKFFFLRNAIAFLIIALMNPQFGKGKQKAISEGIEIMIALDISNSMRALDLDVNKDRLTIAKLNIERLMNHLHGDKVGIVIFAGGSYVQVPLTSDYSSAKMMLSSVDPEMMSLQGTSIGQAIRRSLEAFDMENGVNKAIIVMSDGEDHEGDALSAAQLAKEQNVEVNTVGMGTTTGTVIPDYKFGQKIGLKKDENGNTVTTTLNEEMLMQVAQAGGGSYTRAQGTYVNLDGLLESIKSIDKTELDSQLYTDYVDQFQWFLALGLLFLILHLLINQKHSGIIHKLLDYEV